MLELDGRAIADSTAVIAALEERYPERPLYPEDPEQRRRALELEDFFDEELGPYSRLLAFHDLIGEPDLFAEIAAQSVPAPMARAKGLLGAYARGYTSLRFGANNDEAAAAARAKIVAAIDRLEAELEAGGGEFLVGDELQRRRPHRRLALLPGRRTRELRRCPPTSPAPPPSKSSATASATAPDSSGSKRPSAATASWPGRSRRAPASSRLAQPPIGNRGFAPQKITVPSIPRMWTATMLKTIDFAVAVPTPTGPPEAV